MADHYREAERLLHEADGRGADVAAIMLAEAQVHATLALAEGRGQAVEPVPDVAELDQVRAVLADVLGDVPDQIKTLTLARSVSQHVTSLATDRDRARAALDEVWAKADRAVNLAENRRLEILRLEHQVAAWREEAAEAQGLRNEMEQDRDQARAEGADLRSRAVVLAEDWREQVVDALHPVHMSLPELQRVAGLVVSLVETWLLPGDDRSAPSDALMSIARRNVELRTERQALLDALGAIWLYVDWRYVTRKLTTEQRELWADAVDQAGEPEEGKADRWWRDAD
jgi:hypothetical protein